MTTPARNSAKAAETLVVCQTQIPQAGARVDQSDRASTLANPKTSSAKPSSSS
jgi:hypothetical protein